MFDNHLFDVCVDYTKKCLLLILCEVAAIKEETKITIRTVL